MGLNDRNYEEKRNFIRMSMNASATLKVDGGDSIDVTCIDLSAGGMAINAREAVAEGSTIAVSIESPNEQFKSMNATGTVVRCQALETGEFDLGVEIQSIT